MHTRSFIPLLLGYEDTIQTLTEELRPPFRDPTNNRHKYSFHAERVNILGKLEYYLMNGSRPNGVLRRVTAQFRRSRIQAAFAVS